MTTTEKKYSQNDLDTRERIVTVEGKIDKLSETVDLRFDGIEKTMNDIHKHQTKELTIKDGLNFIKRNYKIVALLVMVLIGGDSLRQHIFDSMSSVFNSTPTSAQIQEAKKQNVVNQQSDGGK